MSLRRRQFLARLRTHWLGMLIVVLYLALGLTYSLTTPPFEAPDEVEHFEYIRALVHTGALPDLRAADRPWRQEGAQPPLAYLSAAAVLRLIDPHLPDDTIALNPHARIGLPNAEANKNRVVPPAPDSRLARSVHLARLVSLGWATLGVIGTYVLARLILGADDSAPALAAALVATLPQFAFIGGAVSNDPATMATATWLLVVTWLGVRRARPTTTRHWATLAGLCAGLAALSKLSGVLAAAFAGATLAVAWRAWTRTDRVRYVGALALYAGMVAIVGGWWYVRNLILYGDVTALRPMLDAVGRYATPLTLAEVAAQAQGVWRSFWGVFGWFNIELPVWIYDVLAIIAGLTVAAGARRLWRTRADTNPGDRPGIAWLALWVACVGAALVQWMRTTPGAQGRLLFPALAALAILAVWCWQGAHARWGVRIGWGLAAMLITLSALTPFLVIRPVYQRPPLATAVPAAATPLSVVYGDGIRLLGYQASASQLVPGATLTVTLWWQTDAPIATNYSVFVHLVGEDGLLVAQDDSFPAGGAWATSLWPSGAIIADVHRIPIPPTTYAPDTLTVHVGMYDHATGARLPASPPAPEESVAVGMLTIAPRPGDLPNPTCINFGDQITLVGYELKSRTVSAGKRLSLDLYWRADDPPNSRYTSFAQVVGTDGRVWGQLDTPFLPDTRQWEPGAVVQDHKGVRVRAEAAPGFYELRIGLYDTDTHELLPTIPGPGCVAADPVVLTRVRVLPREE